jgi:hypothetical protein
LIRHDEAWANCKQHDVHMHAFNVIEGKHQAPSSFTFVTPLNPFNRCARQEIPHPRPSLPPCTGFSPHFILQTQRANRSPSPATIFVADQPASTSRPFHPNLAASQGQVRFCILQIAGGGPDKASTSGHRLALSTDAHRATNQDEPTRQGKASGSHSSKHGSPSPVAPDFIWDFLRFIALVLAA